MKVSFRWLKDYVNLPKEVTAKEVANALTMTTVEVEEVIDLAKQFQQMVVGKVVELKPHSNADRLKLAMTDIGGGNIKQIVCGGTNLFEGMLVAVALPGAMVKWHGEGELVKIEKAKIRGEESFGMICAAEEIGLGDIFPGGSQEILNISFSEATPGTSLAEVLGFDDVVFEIDNKSLTNRPDLWGHYGLAREVAAIFKVPLKEIELEKLSSELKDSSLHIKIKSKACRRYLGVAVAGVKIMPSPLWLINRLAVIGIRSINNIVDLTNYVMADLGQPLHAFDFKYIPEGNIVVRQANQGEPIVTLDGVERRLSSDDLVIANNKQPIAIAGVMGGEYSGINDDTEKVVFESANFDPVSIRKTSKRLNLRTESSARFEKGLDPGLAELGIKRLLTLLKKLQPEVKIGEIYDEYQESVKSIKIEVGNELVNKRVGQEISLDQAQEILERLNFKVKIKGDKLQVEVPSFRATGDISIPEDVVEEIARIYGYQNIKPALPMIELSFPPQDLTRQIRDKVKDFLSLSSGFVEVLTYPFAGDELKSWGIKEDELVGLQNFISAEYKFLRPTLLFGLLKSIGANQRWRKEIKLYEVGRVFCQRPGIFRKGDNISGNLPWQNYQVSALLVGKKKEELFLYLKGVVEEMFKFLEVANLELAVPDDNQTYQWGREQLILKLGNHIVGYLFVLDDQLGERFNIEGEVCGFTIDLDELALRGEFLSSFTPLPKYPSVIYDLAVVFDQGVPWTEVEKVVKESSCLVKKVEPFDVYTGEQVPAGHKSIAFTVEFSSAERTLASEEVETEINKILLALDKKLGGKLRK